MTRECGTCHACCIWPSIKGVKPPRVPCPHLNGGCKIYPSRPQQCQDYQCSWRNGFGGGQDRPDDCGVLIDRKWVNGTKVFQAKSLRPGATISKRGLKAIQRVTDGQPYFVLDDENSNLVVHTNTKLKTPFNISEISDGW